MANEKFDYKKEYKALYMPKAKPCIIDVPAMSFILVDGKGNPNDEGGEYPQAVELLYALSYTIKMSKLGGNKPEGYFEYVVPPLEGLWWLNDDTHFDFSMLTDKEKYCWTAMLRQPEFVTQEVFDRVCKEVLKKKPQLDTSKARLQIFDEGLCVQMLHTGPYDDEPKTIAQMDAFIKENNYQSAISDVQQGGTVRRHHEIYLGDPRKIEPSKRKTVLRCPVRDK
ncbi:MAG: GyrI-like domain-containing protein [Ruminiclostridium sp.]